MASAGAIKAGEAFIEIGADLKPLQAGLSKGLSSLKKFGEKARGIGIAFGVLGAAILTPLAFAVKAASDFEEQVSKFRVVFGQFADEAEEWATDFGEAVGRSRVDLMAFLSTLQDTFVPLGFAREDAAALSKEVTQLAVDLGSFNNVASPTVLRDLQSAIVGNHETMRKYGVIITQATLDQKLLQMGFASITQGATNQQKVLARLNIILGDTTDAQGDAIRTSGSFANRLEALKGKMKDLKIEIGEKLLPILSSLLEALTSTITSATDWISVNADLARTIIVAAAATGTWAAAVGGLSVAIWALTTHPLVALTTGLAVLAVVGITTMGFFDTIIETTDNLADSMDKVGTAIEGVTDKIKGQGTATRELAIAQKRAALEALEAELAALPPKGLGVEELGELIGPITRFRRHDKETEEELFALRGIEMKREDLIEEISKARTDFAIELGRGGAPFEHGLVSPIEAVKQYTKLIEQQQQIIQAMLEDTAAHSAKQWQAAEAQLGIYEKGLKSAQSLVKRFGLTPVIVPEIVPPKIAPPPVIDPRIETGIIGRFGGLGAGAGGLAGRAGFETKIGETLQQQQLSQLKQINANTQQGDGAAQPQNL